MGWGGGSGAGARMPPLNNLKTKPMHKTRVSDERIYCFLKNAIVDSLKIFRTDSTLNLVAWSDKLAEFVSLCVSYLFSLSNLSTISATALLVTLRSPPSFVCATTIAVLLVCNVTAPCPFDLPRTNLSFSSLSLTYVYL